MSWGEETWSLRLDGACPGLELSPGGRSPVLALEGLAVRGRSSDWIAAGPSLSRFDCLFDRVEATYAFAAWGDLTVRATWSLVPETAAIDLEIQVSARSVDFLKALEIQVGTQLLGPETRTDDSSNFPIEVEPRDRDSARLSYDGRETPETLGRLTTLPVASGDGPGLGPKVLRRPWVAKSAYYVELAHPDDIARRMTISPATLDNAGSRLRYGIFGHDLERGVVLRSRMRGFWLPQRPTVEELDALSLSFLGQPLPLGP